MAYSVSLTPAAVRELASLSGPAQRRMIRQLEQLSSEPRREGVKKLQGGAGLYRMHAGKDYVVVYQIDDARREMLIVRVAHRSEAYRNLP